MDDDGVFKFAARLNYVNDFANLRVNERDVAGVIGAQHSDFAFFKIGVNPFHEPVEVSARAFSCLRTRHRRGHVRRIIHASVRFRRIPRLMRAAETHPAAPRFLSVIPFEIPVRLLSDVDIGIVF